jgi:hypothetical protein
MDLATLNQGYIDELNLHKIGNFCVMLQALAGAKQVHVFDHRADETIGWIQEKKAVLSGQGYGQDLETIQALVRQHQVFETDLAAVKEQVCLVSTLVLFTAVQVYI